LYHEGGYPGQQQPPMPQQSYPVPPQGSYPVGQQLPNQSANLNASSPPDYSAGKFIVIMDFISPHLKIEKS